MRPSPQRRHRPSTALLGPLQNGHLASVSNAEMRIQASSAAVETAFATPPKSKGGLLVDPGGGRVAEY